MSYIKKRATAPFNGRVALEQMFKEAAKPSNARYDREIDFAAASALHVDENLQERVNGDGVGESNSFINKVKYGINPIAPAGSYTQTAVAFEYDGRALQNSTALTRGVVFDSYHPAGFTKGYSWQQDEFSSPVGPSGFSTSGGDDEHIEISVEEQTASLFRYNAFDCSYEDVNYYGWEIQGTVFYTNTPHGAAGLTLYWIETDSLFFTETSELIPYVDAQNPGTHLWYDSGSTEIEWVDGTDDGDCYINRTDVPLIETQQGAGSNYYFSRSEYNDPEDAPTYPAGAEHMYAWGDGSEEASAEEPETAWQYCLYTTTPSPTPAESAEDATPLYQVGDDEWVNISSQEESPEWIVAFKGIQN